MNEKLNAILDFFESYDVNIFNGDISTYTSCRTIMLKKYLLSGKMKNSSILLKEGTSDANILRLNAVTTGHIDDYIGTRGICMSFEDKNNSFVPSVLIQGEHLDVKEWVYPKIPFYGLKFYSKEYCFSNIDIYSAGPDAIIKFSDKLQIIMKPTLKEIYELEREEIR